jgi:hypothetical protein
MQGINGGLRELTDQAIAVVAAELGQLERRSGWNRTLAIGELILERFFNGDEHLWRDRRRNKDQSIRRLTAMKACPYGKSMLSEAVGFDAAVALQLLQTSQQEKWTVRELATAVANLRRSRGERRGRPSSTPEHKATTWARRALTALQGMRQFVSESSGALDGADNTTQTALSALCEQLETELAGIRAQLWLRQRDRQAVALAKSSLVGARERAMADVV